MTGIDQEINCDTPGGPLTTRTTVTIDFSSDWRAQDSPWSPPEGMPLATAIKLLLQGLGPRPGASPSSSPSSSPNVSPRPSRSPSRSPSRGAMESSRSPSPLLCEACLEQQLIASPSDCDCPREAPTVRCRLLIYVYMLNSFFSII